MAASGSYAKHAELNHPPLIRESPDAYVIIEECVRCGQRWLHEPGRKYPISLAPRPQPR